jgi:small subunit ribosomal protein S3Ae
MSFIGQIINYHFVISIDPFARKEWYDVYAPTMFDTRTIGKTVVNKTVGTSKWSD